MQNQSYGQPPQIVTHNYSMPAPMQPQVPRAPKPVRCVYIDRTTKNKSFLDMSNYLRATGHKNCNFMLSIIDPDLIGVDPHDKHLNSYYKQKVLRECICNYWYFIREVCLIPDVGGTAIHYKLTRANLATNFCMTLNLNIFEEIPRLTLVCYRRNTVVKTTL